MAAAQRPGEGVRRVEVGGVGGQAGSFHTEAVQPQPAGGEVGDQGGDLSAAVAVAVSYGELVRSAFDTHRLTLLTSLGYTLPTSLDEERQLWQAIAQLLYRRDADRPELLKYHD